MAIESTTASYWTLATAASLIPEERSEASGEHELTLPRTQALDRFLVGTRLELPVKIVALSCRMLRNLCEITTLDRLRMPVWFKVCADFDVEGQGSKPMNSFKSERMRETCTILPAETKNIPKDRIGNSSSVRSVDKLLLLLEKI